MAIKSIPWRSLLDLRKVARHYGDDLLDISPGESFLSLREAHELLENVPDSRWRHCLNKEGKLELAALSDSVDFLEIFSRSGNLTLGAARQGLQVGPIIDKRPGIGHDDAFSIDIEKASDRKLVWALVVVLRPRWIHCGFPCTFWVMISHWTRERDLDRNERDRMESLLYITFSRQLVYYQASHRRHSSIENPKGSVAWDLDIVQDMMGASNLCCVGVPLCAWGVKGMWSGKFFDKTMRFACTFAMEPLARKCPKDHEHQRVVKLFAQKRGEPDPAHSYRNWRKDACVISAQYPLPFCEAWVTLAKTLIPPAAAFLSLR